MISSSPKLRRKYCPFCLRLLRIRRIRKQLWAMVAPTRRPQIWRNLKPSSPVCLWWAISVWKNGPYGCPIGTGLSRPRRKLPNLRKLQGRNSLRIFGLRIKKYSDKTVLKMVWQSLHPAPPLSKNRPFLKNRNQMSQKQALLMSKTSRKPNQTFPWVRVPIRLANQIINTNQWRKSQQYCNKPSSD